MEKDKIKLWNISKNVLSVLGTLVLIYLVCRFAMYFLPFFIALILAFITEPVIKFNMNKLKMSRRMSSIIVVVLTVLLIVLLTFWGVTIAISILTDISKSLPSVIGDISNSIKNSSTLIANQLGEYVSEDVITTILDTLLSVIKNLGTYLQNAVSSLINIVLSVPTVIIKVIITILAFVLFTKDRLNIINMIEYHVPQPWIKKVVQVKNEVFSSIGSYVKIYSKILLLTFIELVICFYFLRAIGFDIKHIIRLSIVIALVDILPVLGIGTVLIPWSLWSFITSQIGLGIALISIYIVLTIIRQIVEPKLVSNQLGIHPIITLFAMYAGFKLVGFSGLLLGPIMLVVLRCVFAERIKKGFFKSLVCKE